MITGKKLSMTVYNIYSCDPPPSLSLSVLKTDDMPTQKVVSNPFYFFLRNTPDQCKMLL